MKAIVLAAIGIYQRYLSPLKGYACAYRMHTGAASCSWVGVRAIRRYGLWRGVAVLRRRLRKCGVAHRRFGAAAKTHHRLRNQAGFCDLSCDLPCDFSGVGDAVGSAWDCLGNCSSALSPCDCCDAWPWQRKRKDEDEKTVYIPPQAGRGRGRKQGDDCKAGEDT